MTTTNYFEKMHNSKLFTLIKGLKPEEIRWFQKFLKSPFYNTNEQYLKLFDYIKKYYPDLDSPKLSKEAACKKLFSKQAFNIQKIRKLMHGLTLLVEEFIVAMRLKNNAYQKKRLLVTELGERNVYDLFQKGTEELVEELEALPYRDEFYFLEQFYVKNEFLSHPYYIEQTKSLPPIKQLSQQLDYHYYIQKLHLACYFQSCKKIYTIDFELSFIERIISEIRTTIEDNPPIINLYLKIYQLFENTSQQILLESVIQDFLNQRSIISMSDKEYILKYLLNFTLFHINSGKSEYVNVNFELYKIGIDEKILIKNNKMTETTYGNIITGGAFLKKFDWTKRFIQQYKIYLDENIREEIVILGLSNIYFSEKKFLAAIELIINKSFSNTFYKIRAKTLLLKSYFEMFLQDDSYYDLILSQLEAFEKYIRRENSISPHRQLNFLSFARFFKKLVHYHFQKQDLSHLQHEISNVNTVSNKPWLLEKTNK